MGRTGRLGAPDGLVYSAPMTFFDDMKEEDRETIISLPSRVGVWISRADDDKSCLRDDKREQAALLAIVEAMAESEKTAPFVRDVMRQALTYRHRWGEWAGRKNLAEDIRGATTLIGEELSPDVVREYKRALFNIAVTVAGAHHERKDSSSEALIGEWMQKISDALFNPLDRKPENISPAEKAALQKLKAVLKD